MSKFSFIEDDTTAYEFDGNAWYKCLYNEAGDLRGYHLVGRKFAYLPVPVVEKIIEMLDASGIGIRKGTAKLSNEEITALLSGGKNEN